MLLQTEYNYFVKNHRLQSRISNGLRTLLDRLIADSGMNESSLLELVVREWTEGKPRYVRHLDDLPPEATRKRRAAKSPPVAQEETDAKTDV